MSHRCIHKTMLFMVFATAFLLHSAGADDRTMQSSADLPGDAAASSVAIQIPADFRRRFVHLGTWVIPDKTAPGHGVHDVYTEPETVDAYRETGEFPEGATLVKEIRTVASGSLTTGDGIWASQPAVWFVMLKDGEGRYQDSALWGDGWVWALYKAGNPDVNVATSYQTDCLACHIPAAKTDHVFVQGYPTLQGR